jgi:hypothetical protein
MLRMRVVIAVAALVVSCAHTPASHWEMNGAYTVCTCDGVERQPTPSEADRFRDGERVDVFCEGKVRDCRPGSLRNPMRPGDKVPFDATGQD